MRWPRWLASVALALLAVANVASGLDRIDNRRSVDAASAPDAIRADPLDPRGLGALAATQLASGDGGSAAETMTLADHLGRRDPLVQAYFLDRALTRDDAGYAASRLDAMLRVNPSLVSQHVLFAMVEDSEAGRMVLRRQITGGVPWGPAYLTGLGVDDEVLAARAGIMGEGSEGTRPSCERLRPMIEELGKRRMIAEARKLAHARCGGRETNGYLTDPRFTAVGASRIVGWQRHASGDVSVGQTQGGVELVNRSTATRLVLSQPVTLAEGEFRAVVEAETGTANAISVSLDCGEPQRPLSRPTIQSTGCEDQVLGVWLAPRSGPVRLRSLTVEPVT